MTRKTKPRAPMPNRRPRSPHLLLATPDAASRDAFSADEPLGRADADAAVVTQVTYPGGAVDYPGWQAARVSAGRSGRAKPHVPRPRESLERCALRAQLRGDPMLGTAFPAARILLVEQPGPWGENGLRDSQFGAEAAAALEARAARAGVRVQAIRRPGRTPRDAVRLWAFADTRDGHESLRWGEYREPAELLELPLD